MADAQPLLFDLDAPQRLQDASLLTRIAHQGDRHGVEFVVIYIW